jgi:hypothetical protein
MKYFGSILEFTEERNNDLLRAYRRQLARVKYIKTRDIFEAVVDTPSARFWVSEERATIVVAAMQRGDRLLYMRPTKREMFQEIYRRYLILRDKYPSRTAPDLIMEVVHQPAPKFYMTPGSAHAIVCRIKRGYYDK